MEIFISDQYFLAFVLYYNLKSISGTLTLLVFKSIPNSGFLEQKQPFHAKLNMQISVLRRVLHLFSTFLLRLLF